MQFRTRLTIIGNYRMRGDTFVVSLTDPMPISVEVVWGAHPHAPEKEGLFVHATCEADPPPGHAAAFAEIVAGERETHGLVSVVDEPRLTDPFVDYCTALQAQLFEAACMVFDSLRWRTGADGRDRPYASLGAQFSIDGQTWLSLPTHSWVEFSTGGGVPLTSSAAADVQALIDAEYREPLAHHLLREATSTRSSQPRSAVVIGVAAVETGFKQLVAQLVPEAKWLVETVPSPPLSKMLSEYLPTLQVRNTFAGKAEKPPKYVRTLMRQAVEIRNKIAHSDSGPIDPAWLKEALSAFRDLLYLFDFYAGQDWAKDELSDKFTSARGT